MQVADSAGSATAFLCGVKGNYETMGVTGRVKAFDCHSSLKTTNRVDSILKWAQDAGKATGETVSRGEMRVLATTPYREWKKNKTYMLWVVRERMVWM